MSGPEGNLEFSNVLEDIIGARTGEIGAAVVCKVQRWSRTNQVVDLVPQVTRDGEELPVVPNVPVLFPVAYQDIQEDTFGVLIVCRDNWRRWWRTGTLSAPEDEATHELTNGIFLPDLRAQGGERDMAGFTANLIKPAPGGTVRLGAWDASKAALHEDMLTDLFNFLGALNIWATGIDIAVYGGGGGPNIAAMLAASVALKNGVLAGDYQSPSVKVED